MNGAQDLGGMHGLGPVRPEPDEPVFHADWERRVFALALAMGFTGTWNLDGSRAARESLPPAEYLASSYYAIWLRALERQVAAHGLASPEEMARGVSEAPARPVARVLTAEVLGPRFRAGFPSDRPAQAPARFAVGDAVRARNLHPAGHTRLPRYVRGRPGRVERVHGAFVLPDSNATGAGENPAWLYTVAFAAAELWGPDADPNQRVMVEMFEPYLDPVAA
ncbi:nitrile hydratase subunit beta [Methylobacterium gregans]|uniref:Nitrile hydratase subunit beta n=1 Tax=Methylobacterium gregans TaxID=374424 RepID=A0AA37HJH2_9HYPH|nr:nitrile hydratase subunit beta [Methylobacterium gregans]MDQ0519668.1 nitrile hydratase [Methylobacterium gregans]GJD76827.1 Low-molecular weight cobalt-containing nitrile hydratase subunit beta [Methylobacterium gregans]GLS56210.1 nitrile hydratase subunit beta protein [Methylobacterium gregans]